MSIDNATPAEWDAAELGTVNAQAPLTDRDITALNMVLARPFGEVPLVTRAYVFCLHQTGKIRLLCMTVPITDVTWNPVALYQIERVEPPKTKPSIDWSQIKPEYKWLARDLSGKAWVYTHTPTQHMSHWRFSEGDGCDVSFMSSYVPGDCGWQDSLVERPQ